MLLEKQRRKVDLIDEVSQRVRILLADSGGEEAARFARLFYDQVPPNDLLEHSAESLCGAALSMWQFGQSRSVEGPVVRFFNPSIEDNGWDSAHTIAQIVNDDMPFLVDSVAGSLNQLGVRVRLVIHPVVAVERSAKGILERLYGAGAEAVAGAIESWMYLEIDEQSPERHAELEQRIVTVLDDVRVVVADFKRMRERCAELIQELETSPPPVAPEEVGEGLAFLRWLNDDHFTFLGAREYRFEGRGAAAVAHVVPESGLGLLRNVEYTVFDGLRHLGRLPRDVRHFVRQPQLMRINKANRKATVHRQVYMDTVSIKIFDTDGNVIGERLLLGLFTSSAYSESVLEIPILRQKVMTTLRHSGVAPTSHDGRALLHILENYPRDELFQMTSDELLDAATDVLHLQERQRIALIIRRDPFERFVSALVFVPRDSYDTSLRLKLQDLVAKAYEGSISAFYTHLSDAPLARLHFIVRTTPGSVPDVDVSALEERLIEAGLSWDTRLERLLVERQGEQQGLRRARRFVGAFPGAYRDRYDEQAAMLDIASIEQAIETGDLAVRLYRPVGSPEDEVRLKMFTCGGSLPLSDVMPMIENMGLEVIDEVPFDIDCRCTGDEAQERVRIRDFHLRFEAGEGLDLSEVRDPFDEALGQIWRGEMISDSFNRLVLGAGLRARQVTVLRAYSRYLRQLGVPFGQRYIARTLASNPAIAHCLVALFESRFDPDRDDREEVEVCSEEEVDSLLERVESLDEDRIVRRIRNLIQATVRTNYYQLGQDGQPKTYLAFKLDASKIEEMPSPRPYREIWVYSPTVEGAHLRGGRVARGGIRWSDRQEDFRSEILGLMKAQMTKNAVIVPVGAKGGFVAKRLPKDAQAARREVEACYRTFIRGLLDLTDNLVEGRAVPRDRVVRHDGDDPYLVVAADKGTATFSDIANEISAEYEFWLDDAFASGGSAGYDHKKMGITARGAWESVKRHFRELGRDIQSEPFTVVGVGDMSGDVFGNGMLLSQKLRLVGAFNHQHIFIDPDPDPESSSAERRRLFDMPASSWADYDASLISAGGGVFARASKSVSLSPEIRRLLGLEVERTTPSELIRALLRAEVDLLWFGGIGTYVKAQRESHVDVGDRPNDASRIDATEVRALVVGEGANLGLTQRARVELARAGVRINTDFIDNSAGVACSDREVNIKILLGAAERAGDLTRKQRNELLVDMSEEVASLVLRGNYLQSQTLTVTHQLGARLLDRLARVMRGFEKRHRLDRRLEFLPDDEEIEERLARREGFTRPELAVLLSYAKNELFEELVDSDLCDDPYVDRDLVAYFPERLRESFRSGIGDHLLRREIVGTLLANEMLDRGGLAFVEEVQEKTGQFPSQIARAYLASRQIFSLHGLWREIEALDNRVPASLQASMLVECGRLVERGTVWLLRERDIPVDVGAEIDYFGNGVAELMAILGGVLPEEEERSLDEKVASLAEQGVPQELARRVVSLTLLSPAYDIVRIGRQTDLPLQMVARLFFEVGCRFGFDWLRKEAGDLPADNAWDKLAISALQDDLLGHQSALVTNVLRETNGRPDGALRVWQRSHRDAVARTRRLISELQALGSPELSMLAVANRQLKAMSRVGAAATVRDRSSDQD